MRDGGPAAPRAGAPYTQEYIKHFMSTYVIALSKALQELLEEYLRVDREPSRIWEYARSLDLLISLLPPKTKARLAKLLGVDETDVTTIVSASMAGCRSDEFSHPLVNQMSCYRHVKGDLDRLAKLVFHVMHQENLFIVFDERLASAEVVAGVGGGGHKA